jgi:hypothetical protein
MVRLSALLILAIAAMTASVDAATITASSCARDAVNAAITQAANGDTVQVPAGQCAWTRGLTINKYIKLIGAGIGQTIIAHSVATGELITITDHSAGSVRLEGFEFVVGATPPSWSKPHYFVRIVGGAKGKPVVATKNKFVVGGGNAFGIFVNRGVISTNEFVGDIAGSSMCINAASAVRIHGDAWASPPTYGAADVNGDRQVYFENNTLRHMHQGSDLDDGGRAVYRHNILIKSKFGGHGADSSSVGARYAEYYGNSFQYAVADEGCGSTGHGPSNLQNFIGMRGGTALIHNNTFQDITSTAWGDKPEIVFFFWNAHYKGGRYPCQTIYPGVHQIGWGYSTGASKSGSYGVPQDREPVYLWNNTGTGAFNNPQVTEQAGNNLCVPGSTAAFFVQAGRDFLVNTPKPGYTPFVYPHPLVSGDPLPPPSKAR